MIGTTGRKISSITYVDGPSWRRRVQRKEPSKADRSACYAARWVAKNIVAAKLARRCEVQLAYAIGVARPVSVMVDTFGTNTVPEAAIMRAVGEVFDLTPRGIMADLDLRKPIYEETAAYGHFGREPRKDGREEGSYVLTWERTDRVSNCSRQSRPSRVQFPERPHLFRVRPFSFRDLRELRETAFTRRTRSPRRNAKNDAF